MSGAFWDFFFLYLNRLPTPVSLPTTLESSVQNKMFKDLSADVDDLLREAGWYEERHVTHTLTLPPEFSVFPRAREVLDEFWGLHFGSPGPGVDCAKNDVKIDPRLASHLASRLQGYGKVLQTRLFPLGEVHGGHAYVIIDEQGRMYVLSAMSDQFFPLAPNFSRCLELVLLGKRISRAEIEAAWPGIGKM